MAFGEPVGQDSSLIGSRTYVNNLVDGQVLQYSAARKRWENATLSVSGGVSSLNGLTGALSIAQGTGITVAAGGSTITVTNAGVTSAVAGSGISVSGATGAVTIGNTGVLSLQGSTGSVTLTAGNGISISGLTISAQLNGATLSLGVSGLSLNLANPNTWTGLQTYGNAISFGGEQLSVSSLVAGNLLVSNGTNWVNATPATMTTAVSVGYPVATTTALGTYLGVASNRFVPAITGKALVVACASCTTPAAATFVARMLDVYFGTGTAPSNGGTVPGTGTAGGSIGAAVQTNTTAAAMSFSLTLTCVITGLTLGSSYWFDLACNGSAATSYNFIRVNIAVYEIP